MNAVMIKTVGLCLGIGLMSGFAWKTHFNEASDVSSAEYMRTILRSGAVISNNPWGGSVQAEESRIVAIGVPEDACKIIAWSTPVFKLTSVNGMPTRSGDPSWTCAISRKSTLVWNKQS